MPLSSQVFLQTTAITKRSNQCDLPLTIKYAVSHPPPSLISGQQATRKLYIIWAKPAQSTWLKNSISSLIDSIFLAIALEDFLLCYINLVKKCCFCAVETKVAIINVTNQWAGLCFCLCICKLCRPPTLIFELSLDEKQTIKLLWPNIFN